MIIRTFGEVAEARSGNNPPQAIIRLSASWEIRCTVLTTKIAFSLLFTKSSTDLVEWLQHMIVAVSTIESIHVSLNTVYYKIMIKIRAHPYLLQT